MDRRRTLLLLVAVFAGLVACSGLDTGARTRLARHFELDDVSSDEAIEAGLAAKLPVGTSEADVLEFLYRSGIGADELSSSQPAGDDGVIDCRIEFDRSSFGFVKESFSVLFRLDERRRLASIDVQRGLKGL